MGPLEDIGVGWRKEHLRKRHSIVDQAQKKLQSPFFAQATEWAPFFIYPTVKQSWNNEWSLGIRNSELSGSFKHN